jgi:hypothetical protein
MRDDENERLRKLILKAHMRFLLMPTVICLLALATIFHFLNQTQHLL